MEWNWLVFALIPVSIAASITFTTWLRVKHGYPLDDGAGNIMHKTDLTETRQIELLSNENADLRGKVGRLEERLAVLERIATDPAERTAREIDNLR